MNIFGFSIIKNPKKKRINQQLEVFKKTITALKETVDEGRKNIKLEPDIIHVQHLAEIQERLESLIEIYIDNMFSRPAAMFKLSEIVGETRKVMKIYSESAELRAKLMQKIEELKTINSQNEFGSMFHNAECEAVDKSFGAVMSNIGICIIEYEILLNAIKFSITYDITRVETGVDIVNQYIESKGYKLPKKSILFTFKMKRLTRDEIQEQIKTLKEEKDGS